VHGGWPSREHPLRIQFICFSINESTISTEWKWVLDEMEQIALPVANDRLNISILHDSLSREILSPDKYSNKLISSLVLRISVDTLRNFHDRIEKKTNTMLSDKVMGYINQNLSDKLTLKDVSDSLNYSVSYLSKYIKLQTGFSIMEYLNIARVERSKKYLWKLTN
jgi:YesN/AraC family two-component response regulator